MHRKFPIPRANLVKIVTLCIFDIRLKLTALLHTSEGPATQIFNLFDFIIKASALDVVATSYDITKTGN